MRRIHPLRILDNVLRDPGGTFAGLRRTMVRTGSVRRCINCDSRFGSFMPYREGMSGLSDFLRRVGYNTGCLDEHACPVCGIGDRERHLLMYFDALGLWETIARDNVLHFAPERYLGERLAQVAGCYVAADLCPVEPGVQAMDVTDIPVSAGTLGLVVCNHVLEHVLNPRLALSEMHRVLRPGGLMVLQTPYASRLGLTLEDPLIVSPEDRRYFYGQEDHMRLFGLDLFDLVAQVGFETRRTSHSDVLSQVDARSQGVSTEEDLILAMKR